MKKYIHGDCMDKKNGLPSLPDNFIDLAIVDPPYGLPKKSSHGRGKLKNRIFNNGNIHNWDVVPPKEYFEQLFRVSKNQIIWGGNYFHLPPCRCFISWDKKQPWDNFSQAEFAWTSFDKPAKVFKFDNKTKNKIHPTQKPIELYQKTLSVFAKEGDLLLDTHVGSASSLIAFESMGYDYVGYEISSLHYKNGKKRMSKGIERVLF